jgi:HAMP domain-containing protein
VWSVFGAESSSSKSNSSWDACHLDRSEAKWRDLLVRSCILRACHPHVFSDCFAARHHVICDCLGETSVKLLAKFNLLLIFVFGIGLALIAWNSRDFLMQDAKKQVLQQAQLMSASAEASRDYTEQELSPILEQTPQHKSTFLPQTIPFYAATSTFNRLRKQFPDYTYREAALNPTNLSDRSADWESDLIRYFRDHPQEQSRIGQRESATGQTLFIARPIVAEAGCLSCHGSPKDAPAAMVKHYGTQNGFGWQQNEIVGARVVAVPMSVPLELANQGFRQLLINLSVIFLVTIILIDLGMYFIVIRPLSAVSRSADRISTGELDLPALPVKGKDEIAQVTASFNRMHTSLKKAMDMLSES